jgi:competence protein ComFC
MKITSAASLLLETLLPRACVLCGSPLPPEAGWPLCGSCLASLRPFAGERCERCGLPLISELGRCLRCRSSSSSFDAAFPLYSYAGPLRDLIQVYKKKRRRSLAPLFAELFAREIEPRWALWSLVPVPPRPGKVRIQGWDQVEEIAGLLEARGFRVDRPLERRPHSTQQKRLGRSERGRNASLAYRLKAGALPPARCLLLDDVLTTCSTIEACASALKAGGAAQVEALVLAAD